MKGIRYIITIMVVIMIFLIVPTSAMAEGIEAPKHPMRLETIEELQYFTFRPFLYHMNSTQNYSFEALEEYKNHREEQKEEIPEDFSDIIKVKVTKEQKEKIENEILNFQLEIEMLAKLIYREARGIKSDADKAAVVWCVLNRVDNGNYGDSIKEVITAKHQFAWVPDTPVKEEFYNLAEDVIIRWLLEKEGFEEVGRVLPNDYLFFASHKGKNRFRKNYRSREYWGWSLDTPYATTSQEDN